jgi:predicted DNA binding CopG/RHH family protein
MTDWSRTAIVCHLHHPAEVDSSDLSARHESEGAGVLWQPGNGKVPKFRSEKDERNFWAAHDSTEFIDWQTAQRRRFPNLKPSLRTISLRLPVSMIEDLKVLANKRDVPYQPPLKVFLAERLERERRRT